MVDRLQGSEELLKDLVLKLRGDALETAFGRSFSGWIFLADFWWDSSGFYRLVFEFLTWVLKNKHQKTPSKGGHHLGLLDPTTHLYWFRESPGAWPTSLYWGPPVIGVAMFLKIDFQVEVILILTTDKRKIVSRKSFKNTQLLLYW